MIEVVFGGVCQPNPGGAGAGRTGAIGVVVIVDGGVLYEVSKVIGSGQDMSCNVAAYTAAKEALLILMENGFEDKETFVYGSSKLVIDQVLGEAEIKQGLYVDIAEEVMRLTKNFKNLRFEWVPGANIKFINRLAENAIEKENGNKVSCLQNTTGDGRMTYQKGGV